MLVSDTPIISPKEVDEQAITTDKDTYLQPDEQATTTDEDTGLQAIDKFEYLIPVIIIPILFIFGLLFIFVLINRCIVVFVTPPQDIRVDSVSKRITIKFNNILGNNAALKKEVTLILSSTSETGAFDLDPTSTFDGSLTTVKLPTQIYSFDFYYKDSSLGLHVITVRVKKGKLWKKARQELNIK